MEESKCPSSLQEEEGGYLGQLQTTQLHSVGRTVDVHLQFKGAFDMVSCNSIIEKLMKYRLIKEAVV